MCKLGLRISIYSKKKKPLAACDCESYRIICHMYLLNVFCQVIEYDRNVIGDSRVQIEIDNEMEPHPTAGYGEADFGYQVCVCVCLCVFFLILYSRFTKFELKSGQNCLM